MKSCLQPDVLCRPPSWQYADTNSGYWENRLCVGPSQWPISIRHTNCVTRSYIINHLQNIVDQQTTRLAYFYLSYKDAEKQNIPNLLLSLVCQLAPSESAMSAELTASYEAHGSGAKRPLHSECTQLLRSTVSRCAKVFLIIDAFDEYPDELRGQLMTELRRLEPRFNIMITSRDLPTIESQLSKAVRLDVRARSDDILGYLRERIASSERLKSHTRQDPTLCDFISTTIATRAEGM